MEIDEILAVVLGVILVSCIVGFVMIPNDMMNLNLGALR